MTAIAASEPSRLARLDRRAALVGLVVIVGGYLPLIFMGPGTDLDLYNLLRSGRDIVEGSYYASRPPGAPVVEGVVGLLDAAGGITLVNFGSMVMAVVTAWAVFRIIDREGYPHASWFALAVLVNPFVWIAGTSVTDFLWALGLLLVGFNLQLSRRVVPTAVFYALAIGCRLPTVLLVAAAVGAGMVGDDAERADRIRLAKTLFLTGFLAAIAFLPPVLTMGWDMFNTAPQPRGVVSQIGRYLVKTFYFFGPVMVGLVVFHLPRLIRSVPSEWKRSIVLRFGLLGFVAANALFLSFPWKLAHLIPALVFLVLILAATRVLSTRAVALLIAAQLLLAVVNLNVAQPDQPDVARSGRLALELRTGPLIKDIQCRRDDDRLLAEIWACVVPWSDGSS